MKNFLLAFGMMTAYMLAQPVTTIGSHQMGETVQQFVNLVDGADYTAKICSSRKRADKLECRNLTDLANGKPGVLGTNDESRDYNWRFVGGKLYELNITGRGSLNAEREIELLAQRYGRPTERKTLVYQNAYGARWECPEAIWEMPDGVEIRAAEFIGADYYGGPTRRMLITFMSRDAITDAERKVPKSNPYGSPK